MAFNACKWHLHEIVILVVVGSSPISHPRQIKHLARNR